MSLSKIEVVDLIEIVENGFVQIRVATKIMDDEKEVGRTFHRYVIAPGDDYSAETDRVKAVCAATHDEWTVAEYKASQEANKLSEG